VTYFYKYLDNSFCSLVLNFFKKTDDYSDVVKINYKDVFLFKYNAFDLSLKNRFNLFDSYLLYYLYFFKKLNNVSILDNKAARINKCYLKKCIFLNNIYLYIPKVGFFKNNFIKLYNFIKLGDICFFFEFFNSNINNFVEEFVHNIFTKSEVFFKNRFFDFFIYRDVFFDFFIYRDVFFDFFVRVYFNLFFEKELNNFYFNKNYFIYNYVLATIPYLNNFNQIDEDYCNDMYITNFHSNVYLFFIFNNFFFKNEDNYLITHQTSNINYTYNNNYPLFKLKVDFINFFYYNLNKKFKNNYLKYVQYYLISFFEYFFKQKIVLKILPSSLIKYNDIYSLEQIAEAFKFYQIKIKKNFHISEVLEII
jgi:hypothetical protein